MDASRRRTLAMLAPLAMALLVVELQRAADYVTLGFIADRDALRSPLAHALFQGQIAVLCLAPPMAGVLVDLHGVRRIVALTMIGWCGLVALGVSLVAPLPYRLGAPLADELVPGFILCAALVSLARVLDPRRRGVAAMLVLLLFQAARERPHSAAILLRSVARGWQESMFLLVAVGAFVATLWLAAFREPWTPATAPARPASPRDVVIAVGAVFWSALVLAGLGPPSLDPLALARGSIAANLPALLAIAVALAAAYGSDRLWRNLGPPPASRAAALLPGFLLAALVGLVGLSSRHPPAAMTSLVAVAAGLLQVAGLLAVDRAPRRAPGLFVGTVLAAGLASLQYAGPLARSLVPHDALLITAGLGGAAWTGLLAWRRPLAGSARLDSARNGRRAETAGQTATGEQDAEREKRHGDADPGQAGVA